MPQYAQEESARAQMGRLLETFGEDISHLSYRGPNKMPRLQGGGAATPVMFDRMANWALQPALQPQNLRPPV